MYVFHDGECQVCACVCVKWRARHGVRKHRGCNRKKKKNITKCKWGGNAQQRFIEILFTLKAFRWIETINKWLVCLLKVETGNGKRHRVRLRKIRFVSRMNGNVCEF